MPFEITALADLLVNAGFVGVTAWLLWERHLDNKDRREDVKEQRQQSQMERDGFVQVIRDNTQALQRISDVMEREERALDQLSQEVRQSVIRTR